MNKKAILGTAIGYWSEEHKCFVVESPLFDRVIGAGDSAEQAKEEFKELLDELYEDYLAGRLARQERPGRPSKGNVEFHTQLKPALKEELIETAQSLNITLGEMIEYLYRCWQLTCDDNAKNVALVNYQKNRSQSIKLKLVQSDA